MFALRIIASALAATALCAACSAQPSVPEGTVPATREDGLRFTQSARHACSIKINCLDPGNKGEASRVSRATATFPEFGNLCLHEAKVTEHLRPAGQLCLIAAADYMDCRSALSCDAPLADACAETRAVLHTQCGSFLKKTPAGRSF